MPTMEMPKSAIDEENKLIIDKCLAEAKLETFYQHRREETNRADLDAQVARSTAFDQAEARWHRALAAIRTFAEANDETVKAMYGEETAAKRDLFLTRASDTTQAWTKIEIFERDLHEELRDGPLSNSILLFEMAGIKADLLNLFND